MIHTQTYFVVAGVLLGILFIKSEVLSWYRIQEMFRFQSVHMYGVMTGALAVATLGTQAIRRLGVRAWNGEAIVIPQKQLTPHGVRYWAGGTIFGLGWGLLGACPGPMFALFGAGVTAIAVAIASAMAGTWAYAALQSRLPH
ncbi:MAG TPA: DUF6691 family protein [Vicinamibacterales bacterium]|nr:DUF6691 family protein [Vicinamibacterales bacterium]